MELWHGLAFIAFQCVRCITNTPKLVMAASIILFLPRKPPTRFTFQFPQERSVWTIALRDSPECL